MPSTLERIELPKDLDETLFNRERRSQLLTRAIELPSGREKPGRFWKIDLDAIDLSGLDPAPPASPEISAPAVTGLIACDIFSAVRQHADLFERAFGRAAEVNESKFAALAAAFCNTGAFVYVPPDLAVDEPVEITYTAGARALFPYTVVLADRGARCTVVERIAGESGAFVSGITEIVTGENASVTYAVDQQLPDDARVLYTRAAVPGKDATVAVCEAELGAALTVASLEVDIRHPGADGYVNGFFFPGGDQHVDLVSTIHHDVGESDSQTLIKSAATGKGQARFLGNIRIAPHAQGTSASLRDDALLLSPRAHIDSVPALEIGANDVKAYHGATIGALDENLIFYMESRGITREQSERMIALGFFEPVIERFPTTALRDRLRSALEAKIA